MAVERHGRVKEHRPDADISSLEGVFGRIFGSWPVITEEARLPAEPPALLPEEAAQVADSVTRRRVEFATGRLCARRALGRLGIDAVVLRNDARRMPQWPPGIVGSLTHTGGVPGGYCAVAVARADAILTVGIDAELADGLPLHLWRFVLTSAEQGWLAGRDTERQGLLAKVIFSAKESFYKAQFPLTGRSLDFHDVQVELDMERGAFMTRMFEGSAAGLEVGHWSGRFYLDEEFVRTALVAPR
jgi:4'-phosphopantetheinyl transferase EntD